MPKWNLELLVEDGGVGYDARNRNIFVFRVRNPETNNIVGYHVSVLGKYSVYKFQTKREAFEKAFELLHDSHVYDENLVSTPEDFELYRAMEEEGIRQSVNIKQTLNDLYLKKVTAQQQQNTVKNQTNV